MTHEKPDFIPHGAECQADHAFLGGRCLDKASARVEDRWVCQMHELYWLREHFHAAEAALERTQAEREALQGEFDFHMQKWEEMRREREALREALRVAQWGLRDVGQTASMAHEMVVRDPMAQFKAISDSCLDYFKQSEAALTAPASAAPDTREGQ